MSATNYAVEIYTDRQDPGFVGLAYRVRWHDADGTQVHEESGACESGGWEDASAEVSADWLDGQKITLTLGQDDTWRARGVLIAPLIDAVTEAVAAFCTGEDDDGPDAGGRRLDMMEARDAAQRAGASRSDLVAAIDDGIDSDRADRRAVLSGLGLGE